jgi:hypothetical protein
MTDRHECLAGHRCRAPITEDGKKSPAKTAAPDTLCEGCRRGVEYATEDLPGGYVSLRRALGDKSQSSEQMVNGTRNPPIPIDVEKERVLCDIVAALSDAADIVSDALQCDPPGGSEPHRVEACAVMVGPNISKLLAAEPQDVWVWDKSGEKRRLTEQSGVDVALILMRLPSQVRNALREGPRNIKVHEPCPECHFPFLTHEVADTPGVMNPVVCPSCKQDWSDHTFGLLGRRMQEDKTEEVA